MTTPSAAIRRSDKVARAAGFERLLAEGLQQVQQVSGERWTDHNLHDPGITVLESLCFALTELAYHADFPVADHLTGPDGRIDFEGLALHAPGEALTCRATTAADYRRLLLDRVDGIDDAHLQPAPASVPGVHRLLLRLAAGEPAARDEVLRHALREYRAQRNLGEDVEPRIVLVRDKPCQLHADIEISGPRDGAEVLADLYHRAGRWVDRSPRMRTRRELLDRGLALEEVYDGPVTQQGFPEDEGRDDHLGKSLYVADLARELATVPGVHEIHALALQTPDGRRHSGSLVWSQADWALRLHTPGGPGDAAEVQVVLRRRQHRVVVAPDLLWRRVQTLHAADQAQRLRLRRLLPAEEQAELPRGTHRVPAPYHSVQYHFPALYGLGRHGLPLSATPQQQARVRQMRAYLLMFEQVLASGEAQVRHLRDLFSVAAGGQQSYWWPVFRDADAGGDARAGAGGHAQGDGDGDEDGDERDPVPGLRDLLLRPHAEIARQMSAHFDRSAMRKSRLLDHLLALHGETFSQNALRQYCGHMRSDELDRRLMANKACFLENIVALSRDRAGAFDDSQPLWGNPANYSGLARRVCLLLGFRHDHARPLTRALAQAGLPVVEAGDEVRGQVDAEQALGGEGVNVVDAPDDGASGLLPDPLVLLARRGPRLLGSLLRAGASHDNYRMLTLPPASASSAPTSLVVVGPDDRQRWWRLGHAAGPAAARRAAVHLRRAFVDINDDCEGLHLVEHVLLRPLQPDSPGHARLGLKPDFHALRLTAVLPDWTVRTHQVAFRRLAEETLRMNAPTHLEVEVAWLNFGDMARFEHDYAHWLARRQAWCAQATPARAQAVDAAACELVRWLPAAQAASAPAAPTESGDG